MSEPIALNPLKLASSKSEGDFLRVPPHNYEAERALLGALLMNNRAYDHVADFLEPKHFADPVNGFIFAGMRALIEQGRKADPITMKHLLEHDQMIIDAGGMRYLANLLGGAVTVVNTGDYGKLIFDLFLRREVIQIGEDMVNGAFDANPDESAEDGIEVAEQQLFELVSGGRHDGALVDANIAGEEALIAAEAAYRRDGRLSGLTTGLRDIDAQMGGMHPSDLIILAGRPSMGKTALATTIAVNAARYYRDTQHLEDKGKVVALFSLEMSRAQLATRIMAELSGLDSHRIRTGKLTQEEFERLVLAKQEFATLPIRIDHSAGPTVATIRTRARRLARTSKTEHHTGLGLIVIDYLQLITPAKRESHENRVQEVSGITMGLKALAKNLSVPVLALSQLSRAVEQREDKRPQLSDLRDSGTIEQDADVVMFVFREEYYLERSEPTQRAEEGTEAYISRQSKWQDKCQKAAGVAECNIAKQRHGPVGSIKLAFDAARTWFADLAQDFRTAQAADGRPGPAAPAATGDPRPEPPADLFDSALTTDAK